MTAEGPVSSDTMELYLERLATAVAEKDFARILRNADRIRNALEVDSNGEKTLYKVLDDRGLLTLINEAWLCCDNESVRLSLATLLITYMRADKSAERAAVIHLAFDLLADKLLSRLLLGFDVLSEEASALHCWANFSEALDTLLMGEGKKSIDKLFSDPLLEKKIQGLLAMLPYIPSRTAQFNVILISNRIFRHLRKRSRESYQSLKESLPLPFESIVKLSHASDFRAYGRTLAIEIQSSAREKSNIPMITTSSNSDLQSQLYLTLSKEAATSGVWEFPANRVWVRAAAKEPLELKGFCEALDVSISGLSILLANFTPELIEQSRGDPLRIPVPDKETPITSIPDTGLTLEDTTWPMVEKIEIYPTGVPSTLYPNIENASVALYLTEGRLFVVELDDPGVAMDFSKKIFQLSPENAFKVYMYEETPSSSARRGRKKRGSATNDSNVQYKELTGERNANAGFVELANLYAQLSSEYHSYMLQESGHEVEANSEEADHNHDEEGHPVTTDELLMSSQYDTSSRKGPPKCSKSDEILILGGTVSNPLSESVMEGMFGEHGMVGTQKRSSNVTETHKITADHTDNSADAEVEFALSQAMQEVDAETNYLPSKVAKTKENKSREKEAVQESRKESNQTKKSSFATPSILRGSIFKNTERNHTSRLTPRRSPLAPAPSQAFDFPDDATGQDRWDPQNTPGASDGFTIHSALHKVRDGDLNEQGAASDKEKTQGQKKQGEKSMATPRIPSSLAKSKDNDAILPSILQSSSIHSGRDNPLFGGLSSVVKKTKGAAKRDNDNMGKSSANELNFQEEEAEEEAKHGEESSRMDATHKSIPNARKASKSRSNRRHRASTLGLSYRESEDENEEGDDDDESLPYEQDQDEEFEPENSRRAKSSRSADENTDGSTLRLPSLDFGRSLQTPQRKGKDQNDILGKRPLIGGLSDFAAALEAKDEAELTRSAKKRRKQQEKPFVFSSMNEDSADVSPSNAQDNMSEDSSIRLQLPERSIEPVLFTSPHPRQSGVALSSSNGLNMTTPSPPSLSKKSDVESSFMSEFTDVADDSGIIGALMKTLQSMMSRTMDVAQETMALKTAAKEASVRSELESLAGQSSGALSALSADRDRGGPISRLLTLRDRLLQRLERSSEAMAQHLAEAVAAKEAVWQHGAKVEKVVREATDEYKRVAKEAENEAKRKLTELSTKYIREVEEATTTAKKVNKSLSRHVEDLISVMLAQME